MAMVVSIHASTVSFRHFCPSFAFSLGQLLSPPLSLSLPPPYLYAPLVLLLWQINGCIVDCEPRGLSTRPMKGHRQEQVRLCLCANVARFTYKLITNFSIKSNGRNRIVIQETATQPYGYSLYKSIASTSWSVGRYLMAREWSRAYHFLKNNRFFGVRWHLLQNGTAGTELVVRRPRAWYRSFLI